MRVYFFFLFSALFLANVPFTYAATTKKTVKKTAKSITVSTVKKATSSKKITVSVKKGTTLKKAITTKKGVKKSSTSKSSSTVKSTTGNSSASASGTYVSAGISADGASLVMNFYNLKNVKTVSYTVTYTSNGVTDGAGGTIVGGGSSTSRSILFGTCSSGVCVYDGDLSNVRVAATVKLKTGKTVNQNLVVLP